MLPMISLGAAVVILAERYFDIAVWERDQSFVAEAAVGLDRVIAYTPMLHLLARIAKADASGNH